MKNTALCEWWSGWHPAKFGTANNPRIAHEKKVASDLLYKSSRSFVPWLILTPSLALTWQVHYMSKNRQAVQMWSAGLTCFRRICNGIIKGRDGRCVSQKLVCALPADWRAPGGMLLFFVGWLGDDCSRCLLDFQLPKALWVPCVHEFRSGLEFSNLESQMWEWPDAQRLFNADSCTEWWSPPMTIHLHDVTCHLLFRGICSWYEMNMQDVFL